MTKEELHILPTDVRLTCLHFMEKTGPLNRPTWRKRLTNPGRTYLFEVFRKIACSEGLQPNPEYSNTQQGLPVYGYTSAHYLDMHSSLALGYFAEKLLKQDPYFQYFSSNCVDS